MNTLGKGLHILYLKPEQRLLQGLIHLPLILQVPGSPAIAGDGEVAGLGVQGEQLQVHRAGQGQGDLATDE